MCPKPNLTVDENSTSLAGVLSFLNEREIRYKVFNFSPYCSDEELKQESSRLGMGLLEAIPVEVVGVGLILAVIPSSLALNLLAFSTLFAPHAIRLLPPYEICQSLSIVQPSNVIPPLADMFGLESFLSPLIERHRTVGFFVGSRETMITLEASEFRRTMRRLSEVKVPTGPKYRAYASQSRKRNQRCILGVSLESADFYTSKLITITDWISKHFSACTVMLGDGLHRITLQLESGASEREALEHSKWLARDFAYSQLPVFDDKEGNCRFDFVFCSEVQTRDCYRGYLDQLSILFRESKEFQDSFRIFSAEFLQRKPQRREHSIDHVELSCRYLLEELAVICCLARDVPCTFVYPGSLTILSEIAEGKHSQVPASLRQIDYVELKLKRKQKGFQGL